MSEQIYITWNPWHGSTLGNDEFLLFKHGAEKAMGGSGYS